MDRTRLSLFYLATYLPVAGLALLLVPDVAMKLLLSNRTYDDVFPRLAGALLRVDAGGRARLSNGTGPTSAISRAAMMR